MENRLPAITGVSEMIQLGEVFERSGMFGCSQQGQGLIIVMTCVQAGITPLEFVERYHIIDGRPSMRADAMLARFLELGGRYDVVERTSEMASINCAYKNAQYGARLTWDEAKVEPFTKDKNGKVKRNWASPRTRMQMLWARVVSDAVRTVCPIVCQGSYTPEEITDFGSDRKYVEPDPDPMRDFRNIAAEAMQEANKIEAEPVAYNVVPTGRMAGKPYSELTDVQIAYMATWDKVTPAHRAAARLEIENRKEKEPNDEDDSPADDADTDND